MTLTMKQGSNLPILEKMALNLATQNRIFDREACWHDDDKDLKTCFCVTRLKKFYQLHIVKKVLIDVMVVLVVIFSIDPEMSMVLCLRNS